jgi:hypothetical protein
MATLNMSDATIRNLKPPPAPKQKSYFDNPAKRGGVRGLMLLHSYGGAKSWHVMHYEDGKSKLFKLGRFPTLGLSDARQAALDFLRDPKAHTEKPTTPDTFEHVVEQFFKIYVAKKGLRTAKIMRQRIDKHLMAPFKDRELPQD